MGFDLGFVAGFAALAAVVGRLEGAPETQTANG